jgi:hypothetical protein
MTTEIQTKRRWLLSVLETVSDPLPMRAFPRDDSPSLMVRPVAKGFALRLKAVTRQAVRVAN